MNKMKFSDQHCFSILVPRVPSDFIFREIIIPGIDVVLVVVIVRFFGVNLSTIDSKNYQFIHEREIFLGATKSQSNHIGATFLMVSVMLFC